MEQLNRNGNRRGMSPESRKNLDLGRKTNHRAQKNISITRIQEAMLPLPCPYAPGKTWAEWLAERGLALAGESSTYYKELLDRLEGKVVQPIGGEDGGPILTKIMVASDDDKKNLERVMNGERT